MTPTGCPHRPPPVLNGYPTPPATEFCPRCGGWLGDISRHGGAPSRSRVRMTGLDWFVALTLALCFVVLAFSVIGEASL